MKWPLPLAPLTCDSPSSKVTKLGPVALVTASRAHPACLSRPVMATGLGLGPRVEWFKGHLHVSPPTQGKRTFLPASSTHPLGVWGGRGFGTREFGKEKGHVGSGSLGNALLKEDRAASSWTGHRNGSREGDSAWSRSDVSFPYALRRKAHLDSQDTG